MMLGVAGGLPKICRVSLFIARNGIASTWGNHVPCCPWIAACSSVVGITNSSPRHLFPNHKSGNSVCSLIVEV
jgi:hypothetical protein